MRKCIISILCVFATLLCSLFGGCSSGNNIIETEVTDYSLRAAVVYADGEGWIDTLQYLEQAPMLGLKIEGVQVENADLSCFDLLYLDASLLNDAPENFADIIEDYTRNGGAVFLPNEFVHFFSNDYLGISDVKKVTGCINNPSYPECEGDEAVLQQTIRDFSELYKYYADYDVLGKQDYGYGFIIDTAIPLVNWDGVTTYALNHYGEGMVFISNPLLPNLYSVGRLTMEDETDFSYASTTTSFNQLLLCGFAEYVAKQNYGYALERVYGYFGTPSMAWELHYEEITGIANHSMQIFSELCEQYNQIPSFTLIRNSYKWFQRAESVTYLINRAESGYMYEMDYYENAYSSGTHVDADGQWLSLVKQENGGSYFIDYPEYTNRAYPVALDYNNDGFIDIFCGSSDGCIYYFEGLGYEDGRLKTKAEQPLSLPNGEKICYGEFSAPQFADVDSDGFLDLICGWNDGKIRWFSGDGTEKFKEAGVLIECEITGQCLPAVGDMNGDGVFDLTVGSDQGIIKIYYGNYDQQGAINFTKSNTENLSDLCSDSELGKWLAPSAIDLNDDGALDLAVGVYDGYIAQFSADKTGEYSFKGYITIDEKNYKGNNNLKFGNWAVPCYVDIDGDGRKDIMCGCQEYGMAYPIDSGYFPYEEELREQVAYAQEHDYYMGIHFYTNAYASAEREAYELQAHKEAFDYYNLSIDKIGVNQHTWRTSSLSGAQTMSSIYDAGLYWQSGFAAPGAAASEPSVAAENVVALPFYLLKNGMRTTLVQNNATLMYSSNKWNQLSARYHMPICIYYHCDFAYESDVPVKNSLNMVQTFREQYGYNFNREDQLMLASAAALHQTVNVKGTAIEEGIIISLGEAIDSYDLYDEEVYKSLGVRLVLSDSIDADRMKVDADVWYRDGRDFVIGLNRNVKVSFEDNTDDDSHISRINMAATIERTEDGAVVTFHSAGMMELTVEGRAETNCSGWSVSFDGEKTIFTKFGSGESLHLIYGETLSEE